MHGAMLRVVGALTLAWLALPSAAKGPAPTILFLVARPDLPDSDSYVLPLRDPQDVAAARTLVESGPQPGLGSIAVARIAAGADGVNRDHHASGKPEWSWHVTEFVEFAENTVELCDGSPTLVEDDVDAWLANTDSTICFWTYTVVQELGPLAADASTWSTIKLLHR